MTDHAPVPASDPSFEGTVVPDRSWYDRPVLEVAHDLLGARLVRRSEQGVVVLRLTEVEAYDGESDPGSHAFRGRTARNATMFGEPGHLYVYRHLGLHHCVNVVCGPEGRAAAVLLRAGEVVGTGPDLDSAGTAEDLDPAGTAEGVELARARRRAAGVLRSDRDLARGPARLTVALGLDRTDDGADVTDPAGAVVLALPPGGTAPRPVLSGPRVGVSGDGGRADLYPWRLWLADEPTVSDYRRAVPRGRRPAGRTAPGTTGRSRAH